MKYISSFFFTLLILCTGCNNTEKLSYEDYIKNGKIFLQKQNNDKAIENFKKAEEIKPNEIISHLMLARLYDNLWQKSYNEAYSEYKEELLHGVKSSLDLNAELVKRGLKNEYRKLAEKEYAEVVRINPSDLEARNYLGVLYLNNKDYHKAIDEFQNSIKYGNETSLVYWHLADAYSNVGDFNRAVESADKAYKIEHKTDYYQYRLGQIYFKMKNYGKAFQMLTTLKNSNSPYYDNLLEFKISNGM